MQSVYAISSLIFVFCVSAYRRDFDSGKSLDYENHVDLVTSYNKKIEKCCATTKFPLDGESNQNQTCCGSELYDISTQSCCGSVVYDIVSGNGCCNGKLHSIKESACCLNNHNEEVIVKFPQDILGNKTAIQNTECCGLKLYNSETEKCCWYIGLPHYLMGSTPYTNPVNIHKKGVLVTEEEYTMNKIALMANQLFFHGRENVPFYFVVEKNDRSKKCSRRYYDRQREFYMYRLTGYKAGKCGDVTFNVYTHICCRAIEKSDNGVLYKSKLHARESPNIQCCGLDSFDFAKELCCNNNATHVQNDDYSLRCCGNEVYDITQQKCCEASNAAVPVNSLQEQEQSCCGESQTPFLPKEKKCCKGNLVANEDGKTCCGTQLIDSSEEICCDDIVVKKSKPTDKCCGHNLFDNETQVCCDGGEILVKKTKDDDRCCGETTYNSKKETCCMRESITDSEVYETAIHQGRSYPVKRYDKDVNLLSCCGLQVYNYSTQECCGGVVKDKEKDLCCRVGNTEVVIRKISGNNECCGLSSFDPETERCCNGSVLQAPADYVQCCGSEVYDPEERVCCKDKLYTPQNRKRMECCSDKLIDKFKQICCRGAVVHVENPLKSTCCYKMLP